MTISAKFPIRKTVTRILFNTDSNIVKCKLAEHLQLFMINARTESDANTKLKKQNEVLSIVLSCVENFQPGLDAVSSIVKDIFNYAIDVFYQLINCVK